MNGVAALHSELLRSSVLRDFHELWPERFSNKTNGVTPRRFLALINPGLSALLDEAIGGQWPRQLQDLRKLESLAGDAGFLDRWRAVKRANKERLARHVGSAAGSCLTPIGCSTFR